MSIIWSGLMPHPPIVVKAVGGMRCAEVALTIGSMRSLARDMVAADPHGLILISPHTPRPARGIAAWKTARLEGHFGNFGAAETVIDLPNHVAWTERFARFFPQVTELTEQHLDHGALVPLHFLAEAGWHGPTCVLGLPWEGDLEKIGAAVARACEGPDTYALLASGDMSHCLKPGAPSGFDPMGKIFDDTFVNLIRTADYRGVLEINSYLCGKACQDVVESCRIAWTATGFHSQNHRFYSYEGPFGVGYGVMKFFGVSA